MGDTDEYPSWALPLLYRRVLWQEYGVSLPDFNFEDMLLAMRLRSLEVQRSQNKRS